MKLHAISMTLLALACLCSDGCKKVDNAKQTYGGKGGDRTLAVTPEHHGLYVDTCMIYIKYNTLDVPADGVYDDSAACVMMNGMPVAVFASLKQGDYYLFAKGYHAVYVPPYVKGGLPCKISVEDTVKVTIPTYSY